LDRQHNGSCDDKVFFNSKFPLLLLQAYLFRMLAISMVIFTLLISIRKSFAVDLSNHRLNISQPRYSPSARCYPAVNCWIAERKRGTCYKYDCM